MADHHERAVPRLSYRLVERAADRLLACADLIHAEGKGAARDVEAAIRLEQASLRARMTGRDATQPQNPFTLVLFQPWKARRGCRGALVEGVEVGRQDGGPSHPREQPVMVGVAMVVLVEHVT